MDGVDDPWNPFTGGRNGIVLLNENAPEVTPDETGGVGKEEHGVLKEEIKGQKRKKGSIVDLVGSEKSMQDEAGIEEEDDERLLVVVVGVRTTGLNCE